MIDSSGSQFTTQTCVIEKETNSHLSTVIQRYKSVTTSACLMTSKALRPGVRQHVADLVLGLRCRHVACAAAREREYGPAGTIGCSPVEPVFIAAGRCKPAQRLC